MIKKLAEHRIAFLLLVVLLLIQSFSADLNDPYKKPIAGDAKGYYAYLPAIFIYRDFDYSFIPGIERKYYPPGYSKSFVQEINGQKVNKTFPGVTLLYLPFFLIAHAVSLLAGLPADGYAYTYQLLYTIGFWWYFLLAMIFFKKVLLLLDATKRQADIALIVCVLGTNIFFYTLYDSSVTHIYNFFLVSFAIYLLLRLKAQPELKKVLLFFATLAVIGITRPTNFLVLLLIPIFIPEKHFYAQFFRYLFRFRNAFLVFLMAGLILAIPFILWKLQTGSWVVYSYGEEGFNFAHPEIINFLFSYTKGWFVYTPIVLFIIIFGIILLFRSDQRRAITALLFYAFSIYIFSSWWCWYYGAGMSQRVMIDYTLLIGFFVVLITRFLQQRRVFRMIALTFTLLMVSLNAVQAWQIANGILPMGSPTKQQYWDNFLAFRKKARIYPQEHWVLKEQHPVSFNPADGNILKGTPYRKDDQWQINVSDTNEFSPVVHIETTPLKKGDKCIFSFEAYALNELTETRMTLVVDGMSPVFFIGEFAVVSEWTLMEYMVEFTEIQNTSIDLYFWNAGSGENVEFRNLVFSRYFSAAYF